MARLTMRSIRQHPAVVSAEEFQPELEVALCRLVAPIGVVTRLGQASLGFAIPKGQSRLKVAWEGFQHTPAWGIAVEEAGRVNWVNRKNSFHRSPYASVLIERTSNEFSSADYYKNLVPDIAAIKQRAAKLPGVTHGWHYEDEAVYPSPPIDSRVSFESLGLTKDCQPWDRTSFVVDLNKLEA